MQNDIENIIKALCDEDKADEAVKLITALSAEEQTDEIKTLLGRAYNSLERYEEALSVLMSVKESQAGTALWNFRVGYAYYFQKNYPEALRYFREASVLDPEDDDARDCIAQCELERPFTLRVSEFWNWFRDHAEEIEIQAQPEVIKHSKKKFGEWLSQGLSIIGNSVACQIGIQGLEIYFSIMNFAALYMNPYIVKKAPAVVRGKWDVFCCRHPLPKTDFVFSMYHKNICLSDVMVQYEYDRENKYFDIKYYHSSLAQLDDISGKNMFQDMLDLVLGDGPVHNYINNVELVESSEGMFPLTQLPEVIKQTLEENGITYSLEPELPFRKYERKTNDEDCRVRFDITKGTTNCMPLIVEYYYGEDQIYHDFVCCGIAPMMLIIQKPADMGTKYFMEYLGEIQERIEDLFQQGGNIEGQIIGNAYGRLGYGYIDLLVYDKNAFMEYIENPYCLNKILKPQKGVPMPTTFVQDFVYYGEIQSL